MNDRRRTTEAPTEHGAEPLRSECHPVRSRGRQVPLDLRLQIQRILADEGPMTLDRLLRSLVSDSDPAAAVMSLCREGLLELDPQSDPVGPSTVVRSRT
ncbi:hypothetical protein [Bradyrhizobium yuanmingense]|uniref:hypothetical protein n=1 Tax=Bradyrhizobium yuanmingense TaxID=108015 RepID=UPI001CD77EDA|nr:hypothetical protein [Bradyrhizobium yuanmingense]MCA1529457.1 hypothetical protein [Bradyrhizobium yuanmingense]